jgi:D-tyrosyl-tRNA(Tyr) deacylase
MRAVLQRVTQGRVSVEGKIVGQIGAGIVALVAVGRNDTAATAAAMA